MEISENQLASRVATSQNECSSADGITICSSVSYNDEGNMVIDTNITFPEEYIVTLSETSNELLKLSEQDREVIRVREIRYHAVPGTPGVTTLQDELMINRDELDFEEIITVSLMPEPSSYLRPKFPKYILINPPLH